MKPNAPVREKLAPFFAVKAVLGFYALAAIGILAFTQISCSTDKAVSECIREGASEENQCNAVQVDVDVDEGGDTNGNGDGTGNGTGNGNGNGNGNGDDPSQADDCTTESLGSYVDENVLLGELFRKECEDGGTDDEGIIKLFVEKNAGGYVTLEYTDLQVVLVGGNQITCTEFFKRYDFSGNLIFKQTFDEACNLVTQKSY